MFFSLSRKRVSSISFSQKVKNSIIQNHFTKGFVSIHKFKVII
ncbi:hypothetical protein NMS_1266 [Nonlabens marinus S1-08]|uniref:Uncharacterized protein n=1 Tax=Nonlabens marinus S1-08 TaxID=1454201 RepID=W8VQV7_9FLAO|nr:hypothetical protein NMS_1266 [Nonlabens marinus S1-08]